MKPPEQGLPECKAQVRLHLAGLTDRSVLTHTAEKISREPNRNH